MTIINKPKQIKQPFAINGLRNEILDNTKEEGKANYSTGFPNITMLPKEAGGLPVLGEDMNGILYDLSENIVYNQAGGTYGLNEDIITNRGGYPKNAMLIEEDNKIYLSKHNNNISNYKTDNSVIGLDWDMIVPRDYKQRIVGKIIYSGRNDTPDGCLRCNGRTYAVSNYDILTNEYLKKDKLRYLSFEEYKQELMDNNNNCYCFGYETNGDTFRVPTINTGIQFYNAFVVVSDVYGTPVGSSKQSTEIQLIEEFNITKPIKYLAINNIDDNYRHKITIADLKSDYGNSGAMLNCQVGCNGNYVTNSVYGWNSDIFNSNEAYSYIKNKNQTNSYQITNDRYSYSGVTGNTDNGYFNLELEILNNRSPYHPLKSNLLKIISTTKYCIILPLMFVVSIMKED